ncbi:uncharacterized protein LOC105446465 [Strongylocentrotus purpuratus]|uniref:C-factor n=1 Tax=Strongylocentrotus purpuratus TaxID=7668 RepID=A0A7M7NMV0_STRPU|nr:uncharacterized protein LOC105446465 [Strongylocentrotus purpuratus]XP_030838838.1 uncharacterized protein LOC105446465 [Strongylocentrotus purpuratus]
MRTVLITGTSRGIGLEFVRQLALLQPGPEFIFASCRAPHHAKELQAIAAAHRNVKILEIDVQDESTYGPAVETVSNLVGAMGLNVLINNAGIVFNESYETVSREVLFKLMDSNFISPLRLTQAFLPLLRQGALSSPVDSFSVERGAVINMTSGLSSISENTTEGHAGHRESKAALNMFTKSLSLLLEGDKILVVSQNPGYVKTDGGGPGAKITPQESVTVMLKIFSLLSEEYTGSFLAHRIPLQKCKF